MDAQQHRQDGGGRDDGGGDQRPPRPCPFRGGDYVRLNATACGKWARRAGDVAMVIAEPRAYMCEIQFADHATTFLHYCWLEPAQPGRGGGGRAEA